MVASQRHRATNQVGVRMRWHNAIAECDQGTNEMVVVACVGGARPPVRAVVMIEVPLMGEWRCGGKWQGSGLIALRADPYFAVRARPRQ